MAKHFSCTGCGKCCYGQLPLTLVDAFANLGRFPICFLWTVVAPDSKDFAMAQKIGATIALPHRKELAVLIVPTSFIPATFACPALGADHLCSIHSHKPSRCKAMPFYPYREERYQGEGLTMRPGWACDTSDTAPIVFENQKIVDRADYDHERHQLLQQVPIIRQYCEYVLKYSPAMMTNLMVSSRSKGSQIVTSLSSFLTATRHAEAHEIAALQLPVLRQYAELTANDPLLTTFHRYYQSWATEMEYLVRSGQKNGTVIAPPKSSGDATSSR
jgi:Fe-S-cluster containining protein